ncbi:MAG: hypothetical protein ACLU38_09085 [Dysosmobacter sp.]
MGWSVDVRAGPEYAMWVFDILPRGRLLRGYSSLDNPIFKLEKVVQPKRRRRAAGLRGAAGPDPVPAEQE